MHLDFEQHYPASVTDVGHMLGDEAFVRWRAQRASGPGGFVELADVTGSATGAFTVATRRTVATAQIPHHVRQVVGMRLEIRHTEAWEAQTHGQRTGTVAMEITGAPVRLVGAVTLEPDPLGGCVQRYSAQIKATVPLFGDALEKAADAAVRAALTSEEEAGREWLTGTGGEPKISTS